MASRKSERCKKFSGHDMSGRERNLTSSNLILIVPVRVEIGLSAGAPSPGRVRLAKSGVGARRLQGSRLLGAGLPSARSAGRLLVQSCWTHSLVVHASRLHEVINPYRLEACTTSWKSADQLPPMVWDQGSESRRHENAESTKARGEAVRQRGSPNATASARSTRSMCSLRRVPESWVR